VRIEGSARNIVAGRGFHDRSRRGAATDDVMRLPPARIAISAGFALASVGFFGACGSSSPAPPGRGTTLAGAAGLDTSAHGGAGGAGPRGTNGGGAGAQGLGGVGASGAGGGAGMPESHVAGAAGASGGFAGVASAGDGGAPSSTGGRAGVGASGGRSAGGRAGAAGSPSSAGASAAGSASVCASAGPAASTPLAFPEAEGFGRHASGGRDGTVVHVTNLNDSGAGSFRDAVSQGHRIVVFDVGGYVALKTAVSVESNVTLAGQSAPGEGIGFRGGEISFAESSNIIARYLRIRPGSDTASSDDDALSLYRAQNVIVDHVSLEFAPWNDIDGVSDDWQNHPVTNITFQDSLIADPTGQQFGAHTESVSSQWSWYRNVFANSHNRNPLAKVNTVFVNNVLYNCSAGYTTHTSTAFQHDIVNNAFIFGPASTGTDDTWFQIDENQSIYDAGNLKDDDLNGSFDGAVTHPSWYQGTGTVLHAPWSSESATPYDAASAYRIAVSRAGALPRDPVDALVISQVRTLGKGTTGTGANTTGPGDALYTSQTQTGLPNDGYGDLPEAAAPTDSDHDGMPDFWEQATGSDPALDDAMKKAPDGYALVERYLDWLAEPHAVSAAGASVDLDLATLTLGFADAKPTFTLAAPSCGSVVLTDAHTARFTPTPGTEGVATFDFSVAGADGTTYRAHVAIAIVP
jgi:pectate lyase